MEQIPKLEEEKKNESLQAKPLLLDQQQNPSHEIVLPKISPKFILQEEFKHDFDSPHHMKNEASHDLEVNRTDHQLLSPFSLQKPTQGNIISVKQGPPESGIFKNNSKNAVSPDLQEKPQQPNKSEQGGLKVAQQPSEWWPMKIGSVNNENSDIATLVKPNEYDVYPLSIYYPRPAQFRMKIYRIFALLALVILVSPISIYYKNSQVRVGFFANELTTMTVGLYSIINDTFDVNITNCNIFWYTNEDSPNQIKFQMAYDMKSNFTSDGYSFIYINQQESSAVKCIINIYFPINIRLPQFHFNINGTMENIILDDSHVTQDTMFNFSSVAIEGPTAFITLSNHNIDNLTINLNYSLCNMYSVKSKIKNVYIYTGYYNEHISQSQNSTNIYASQNQGIICLVAPKATWIYNDSSCINETSGMAYTYDMDNLESDSNNFDISGVYYLPCIQNYTLCIAGASCSKPKSFYNITVRDGPIQIRYDQTQPNQLFNTNDQLITNQTLFANLASSLALNSSGDAYVIDTANAKVSILQTVGIDYAQTWFYTNQLPFLEALVWPLSWASLTLLRPELEYKKIVIIDSKCPARGTTQLVNYNINSFYELTLPSQAQTAIALVTGYSKFAYITANKFGKLSQTPVQFSDNVLNPIVFALSAAIAFFGAGFVCIILTQIFKVGKKKYAGYIDAQRHLAYTRQQAYLIETTGQSNITTLTYEQNQIIESRGVFSAHFEKASFGNENQKKHLNQINFSIYQVPAIYIDSIFRKRANSFQAFLNAIDESKYHFTNQKMKNEDDVSIPIDYLERDYSNFCQRCGYKQLKIVDQISVIEQFELKLDFNFEKQKPAYCFMRFKTTKEKQQKLEGISGDSKSGAQSTITMFLEDECSNSSFKEDCIFIDELQDAYIQYCDMKNKPESERQQLANCEEIKKFGATIQLATPPPVIIGLKRGRPENSVRKASQNVQIGLVRKPINMKNASIKKRVKRIIKMLISDQFSPDKPLANFAVVGLHFVIIYIFPLLYSGITYFAISEISRIQSDVYGEPVTFSDIANANRLDQFYYDIPYFTEFCYAQIYLGFYVIFAFFELLSFYVTNYDNQGKFPVKYTTAKKIQTTIYQVSLFILLFVLVMQTIMAGIWAILAAIINPQRFLPYATAAIALFGVIMAKLVYYKKKYQTLVRKIQKIVADMMTELVEESIGKLKKLTEASDKLLSKINFKDKANYSTDINSFFKIDENSKSKGGDKINNVAELAKITSARLGGLQPTIIEACLAILANNKFYLNDQLAKLSTEFNMDPELIQNIVELSMSEYNPDQFGISDTAGLVVVSVKRLFRRLFQQLNVEMFGDLIQIVTEGDSRPLNQLFSSYNFQYKNLFEAMIHSIFADEKPKVLSKKLLGFIQDIAIQNNQEDQIYNKFKILFKIQDGQVDSILENLDIITAYREELNALDSKEEKAKYKETNPQPVSIANTIGFQYNFPLMCMIALQKSNSSLSRTIINQTFKEIIIEQGLADSIEVKYDQAINPEWARFNTQANQLYQCLYLIIKGKDIDFSRVDQDESCKVNIDNLEELHQCSMNNIGSFGFIINAMQCTKQKDILLEFYAIMQKQPYKATYFCDYFAISGDKSKTVSLIIILLYKILKFEKMMEKMLPNDKQKLKSRDKVAFAVHTQEILETVLMLQDREYIFNSDIKSKLQPFLPKDSDSENLSNDAQSNNDGESHADNSRAEGSQKSGEDAKLEEEAAAAELLAGNAELSEKEQIKKDIKKLIKGLFIPTKQISIKDKKGYQVLWDFIFQSQKVQNILSDEASLMLRCYSVVMLKTDNYILSTESEYIKCYKTLANFFDVSNEKVELLIDLISGNPLDIFKQFSKNLGFDPGSLTFFNAKFDQTRLNILSLILQSNTPSLVKVCAFWYSEFLTINQGEQVLPIFLRNFNIRSQFIKILQTYQVSQSENHTTFNQYDYNQQIISYLNAGLKQSKKILIKKANNLNLNEDDELYTDTIFIEDKVKAEQKDLEVIQLYEDFQLDKNTISRIEELLLIKQGSKKILYKFFNGIQQGDSNNYIRILSALLQVSSFNTPNTVLDFLQTVSQRIPLFDAFENEDTKQFSYRNQNLFVQLNLILNSFSFQNKCRNSEINDGFMNSSIQKMIALANKSNKENGYDEIIFGEDQNFNHIIKSLYEHDYFKDISVQLFGQLGDLTPKQCNYILGLFLGCAFSNSNLLRNSVVGLLQGHQVNLSFVRGISGVLMGDLTAEHDIKLFARQLDLDGQLIINILDLCNQKTQQLPNIIHTLFSKDQSDQIQILTSLIYCLKKDVTNIKPIANKLGIDAGILISVLAAAVGKTSILSNFYQDLAQKFNINNQTSVRYTVEISKGETNCISELQNKKSKLFNISDPELVKSVIYILNQGQSAFGQKSGSGSLPLQLDGSLAHLSKKLRTAFSFEEDAAKGQKKRLNEALPLLFYSCWSNYQSLEIIYKRLRGEEIIESQSPEIQQIPIKTIWLKENPFLYQFSDDLEFMTIYNQFQKLKKSSKYKLIKSKFQQVTDDFDSIQSQIREKQTNMIEILKIKILPEINKRYQNGQFKSPRVEDEKTISPSKKNNKNWLGSVVQNKQEVYTYANLLEDIYAFAKSKETKFQLKKEYQDIQLYEAAFRTGCTFGITLFKKLRQPFFYCLDCNGELEDENLGICITCALFCHNGHNLKPGNYGTPMKVVCDCGSGKFNTCKKFLDQNPLQRIDEGLISTNDVKSCTVLKKHFHKVQDEIELENYQTFVTKTKDSKSENLVKTEQQKIDDILLIYTNEMFFNDLVRAIDLPDYFGNKELLQSVFHNEEFQEGSIFSAEKQLIGLRDILLGRNISLIENLILLSSGRCTDSFVTLLTSKHHYKYDHYQNQLIYSKASKNGKVSKTQGEYNALNCFISMVQGDNQKFQKFGQGYVDALGESGSKEVTAKDKICNILRISNGGKLPLYIDLNKIDKIKSAEVKSKQKNGYVRTFQKLFGINGVKIIALHKLLTLKKEDLIKISMMNDESDLKDNPELKNIQNWINNNLYSAYFQLDQRNIEWIKTIIRLCCQDMDAFSFIVQEKKIPPLKAQMYKAILTANKYELQPIFEKLKTFIPQNFNKFLNQVWNYDRKAIIDFIFRYVTVDTQFIKSWKDVFKNKMKQYDDFAVHKFYLFNLFSLISGETMMLGEKMASVIGHITSKKDKQGSFKSESGYQFAQIIDASSSNLQKMFKPDNFIDKYPKIYRLVYALVSVHGIFTDNVLEIPQIVRYFDEKKRLIKESEALSLIQVCDKSWNQPEVEFILKKLIEQDQSKPISTKFYQFAKQILQASEGDLESLGKVSDEIFADGKSHIRSLLISCITGNTKFDYLDDVPDNNKYGIDVEGRKNLLKREIYYIYEKITKFSFKTLMQNHDEYIKFLDYSFKQKIPLHLFCVLSENYNTVCKLFSPNIEFSANLNKKFKEYSLQEQNQYLQIFLDFLSPFTQTNNIKPILKKVLNIKNDDKLMVSVKKLGTDLDDFKAFAGIAFSPIDFDNTQSSIKNLYNELQVTITDQDIQIEMISLIELVMQCFQGNKSSFVNLHNIFYKLFDNIPILSNSFYLIQKLLLRKKASIFDNLPAVVAIIILEYKGQLLGDRGIEDKDKLLIPSIVAWMEAVMIMLDKENSYDNQSVKQKLDNMVRSTLAYYGDDSSNIFINQNQNVSYIVDVIQGMISMSKQNFEEMERMSMKIGGFPDIDKLNEFFKLTSKYAHVLDFGGDNKGSDEITLPEKEEADPSEKQFDAKGLFLYFSKNSDGKIGIEEFKNVCKNLGMKPGPRILKIFSKVDVKHTGELNFFQFNKALFQLQLIVVEETIEKLGLSINDMTNEFAYAIVLLIMIFIFVFIGIEAFAPVTGFSAVMNSTLIGGAGGAVGKNEEEGDDSDDHANAAGETMDSS